MSPTLLVGSVYPIYIHPCPSLYTTGLSPPFSQSIKWSKHDSSCICIGTCCADLWHQGLRFAQGVELPLQSWSYDEGMDAAVQMQRVLRMRHYRISRDATGWRWGCTGARHIQCSPAGWHAACLLNTSIEIITNVVVAKIVAIDIDIASSLDTCRAIVILLRWNSPPNFQ